MVNGDRAKHPLIETKLSPIIGIFLTVLIDMLGFAMFIPDIQLRGKLVSAQFLGVPFDSDSLQLGLLVGASLSVYSLAQLVTSPWLGRVSDQFGRRKVLIITTLLALVSYVVYAHANHIGLLFLSRILSGVAAGNLGVAFAYVADVTRPEDRAKGLGLIGMAFGIGFIVGPAAGALLLNAGNNSPLLLSYVAAALAGINYLYILLFLPESLQDRQEAAQGRYFANIKLALSTPGLQLLLGMFFAINLGFMNLESTFFQLLADPRSVFALGEERAKTYGAIVLVLVGVVGAIVQGGLVQLLIPRYGEVKLVRFGYLFLAPVLALTPFAPLWVPMILIVIGLGVSSGLAQPSISSLISRSAPPELQGGIFGVTQSLGALARLVGPLLSNPLFSLKPYYPYFLGAIIVLIPAVLAWRVKQPVGEPALEAAVH